MRNRLLILAKPSQRGVSTGALLLRLSMSIHGNTGITETVDSADIASCCCDGGSRVAEYLAIAIDGR